MLSGCPGTRPLPAACCGAESRSSRAFRTPRNMRGARGRTQGVHRIVGPRWRLAGSRRAFEAIAYPSIKLARAAPEEDRATDVLVAEAILEFGDDLRSAGQAATEWGIG